MTQSGSNLPFNAVADDSPFTDFLTDRNANSGGLYCFWMVQISCFSFSFSLAFNFSFSLSLCPFLRRERSQGEVRGRSLDAPLIDSAEVLPLSKSMCLR